MFWLQGLKMAVLGRAIELVMNFAPVKPPKKNKVMNTVISIQNFNLIRSTCLFVLLLVVQEEVFPPHPAGRRLLQSQLLQG